MGAAAHEGSLARLDGHVSSPFWVRSPAWDAVWLQSALWLAPLALWLVHRGGEAEASPLDWLYFALTALFWIGHRLASAWLAYCTEAYRPLRRAEPLAMVFLPLAVTAACFAFFLPADAALPWTRAERVAGLAILDYALVTHHFASQHFGALALYRVRAGASRSASARRLDRLFALGVGGVLVLVADALAGAAASQELWLDRWIDPAVLASVSGNVRSGALVALLLLTGAVLLAEVRAARPSLPRVLYVLGVAAMVAIALQPRSLFPFLVMWTSQHWILATGLAAQTPSAEPRPVQGRARVALHALNARPWALLLVLLALSALLLPIFEVEANRNGGTYYGDWLFGAFATSLRSTTWVPALIALGFATGFNHYILDRAVFRFSNPRVREAAAGLLSPRPR